jgi:hypothetical protein
MKLSKEEFLNVYKEVREVLNTDENAQCSCPNIRCELHGDCYNCIRVYRHFGRNVPRCLQFILEKKITQIIQAAEEVMQKRPKTPDEYFDYLNEIAPKNV